MSRLLSFLRSKDSLQFAMFFALFFSASFVYNIMLPLKKTVIMYIPGAGTESIAYLKPFVIAPGAIVLTFIYLRLSSSYNKHTVFRTILGIFSGYFFLYRFLLAPNRELFAAHTLGFSLTHILPESLHAAPPLVIYWMDTIFYAMGELWGTTVVSLMIWGLVNQSMTKQKAQAQYGLLTIGANSSAIAAGMYSLYLGKQAHGWENLFDSVLNCVLVGSLATWVLYETLVYNGWLSLPETKVMLKKDTAVAPKQSFGLTSSFLHIYNHPQLWAIAIIVIGYNILYTFSDFMFIKQVELYFGPEERMQSNDFLSSVALYSGVSAIFFASIIYPIAIRLGSWLWAALLTPLCFIITGVFFYGSQYIQLITLGGSSLFLGYIPVMAGAMHIAMLRGARYSVYDATKEAAYVGLPLADQIQGKAAIDAVTSRVGKSFGSIIFCGLFALVGNSITKTIPYVMMIGIILTGYWLKSIFTLNAIRRRDVGQVASGNKSGNFSLV